MPLAGDTDGDGADSQHLFRGGLWLLRDQEQGAPRVVAFGTSGDQPLLGDWDGDGVDTLGLFRGGSFLLSDRPSRSHRRGRSASACRATTPSSATGTATGTPTWACAAG